LFCTIFDIDLFQGLTEADLKFGTLMFHRRHVYEHNGGEADEKYVAATGDSVRLKQTLRETQESVHRTANFVLRLCRNLHAGFHELLPPLDGPIKAHDEEKRRLDSLRKRAQS